MSNPEQPHLHNSPENPAGSDAGSAIRPDQEHAGFLDKLPALLRRFLPAHKTLMQKDVEKAVKASEKEEEAWQDAYPKSRHRIPPN